MSYYPNLQNVRIHVHRLSPPLYISDIPVPGQGVNIWPCRQTEDSIVRTQMFAQSLTASDTNSLQQQLDLCCGGSEWRPNLLLPRHHVPLTSSVLVSNCRA